MRSTLSARPNSVARRTSTLSPSPPRRAFSRLLPVAMAALVLAGVEPARAQVVTQPFTFNLVAHDLPHVRHGDATWGDFDADGDLDVFLTGIAADGGTVIATSGLYLNTGPSENSVSFLAHSQNFAALYFSMASWADVDGDGDLDLILVGSQTPEQPYEAASHVYINNGGSFTEAVDHGIPAAYSAAMDWGDINNDGNIDAVMVAFGSDGAAQTSVLIGDGDGSFSERLSTIQDLALGEVRLSDVNGDGRLDALVSGVAGQEGFVTDVYLATDNNGFALQTSSLPRVGFSTLETGDLDGDGDDDLLVSGGELSRDLLTGRTTLFDNENGTFRPVESPFAGSLAGAATLGDYDGDGDLDVLVLGAETALGRRSATVYANLPDGSYQETIRLHGSLFSSAEWADVDGDGDLDLLTTGFTSAGIPATNLYLNQQQVIPALPSAPVTSAAEVHENEVQLSWTHAAENVTYNLRVGTAPGLSDIVATESHAATAQRLVPRPGNVRALSTWTLQGLEEGTYYWSVQAVSHAFHASAFSGEGTFTVTSALVTDTNTDVALPTEFAVRSVYPNPLSRHGRLVIDLPAPDQLNITLYDARGARVARSALGPLGAGTQQIALDPPALAGRALSPGLYFFEIEGHSERRTGSFTYLPTR